MGKKLLGWKASSMLDTPGHAHSRQNDNDMYLLFSLCREMKGQVSSSTAEGAQLQSQQPQQPPAKAPQKQKVSVLAGKQ